MKHSGIKKPIFFIGFPRSGTTIIFEAFARHETLAWPSNYSMDYPGCAWMNIIRRLHDNKFIAIHGLKKQYGRVSLLHRNRFLCIPNEAYEFWDLYSQLEFSRNYLANITATEIQKKSLHQAVFNIAKYQGKVRFSAKFTGPPRIHFLKSCFPDAKFIHIIRDGRAVVHSTLKVDFWKEKGGYDAPFWGGGLEAEDLALWYESGKDPGVLAALQWNYVINQARQEASSLKDSQYIEIQYDSFIDNSHDTLENLFSFCDLPASSSAHKYLNSREKLVNMSKKYTKEWSEDYIKQLTSIMFPLLSEFGYV